MSSEIITRKIAVVGSGVAGLGAAWALGRYHDVKLFEREDRLGGHARTIEVPMGGRSIPVDTGFIVYNERNYPNLTALFDTLDVPTKPSDMSFAVSQPGFEFAASPGSIVRNPAGLMSPRLWGIVAGIARFRRHVAGHADLAGGDSTLLEYLEAHRFPRAFVEDYLLPLTAAVWSGSAGEAAGMPVGTLLRFLSNHGLFDVDRPQWRTVDGGSREYVERVGKEIPRVETGTSIRRIERLDGSVAVHLPDGVEHFDEVVLATHAPVSLALLGDAASSRERVLLGTFGYAPNRAVVHRDPTFMPRRRSVWSSWNSLGKIEAGDTTPVAVTYWMNRLQSLDPRHPVFITLNPDRDPANVIDDVSFAHPQFTPDTDAAQRQLSAIQGTDRVWFAGAWTGHGFHEDGLRSGLDVAAALGAPVPWSGLRGLRRDTGALGATRDLVAA